MELACKLKYREYILILHCIILVFNETLNMLIVCFHNKTKNEAIHPFTQEIKGRKKTRKIGKTKYKSKSVIFKGVSRSKFDLVFVK